MVQQFAWHLTVAAGVVVEWSLDFACGNGKIKHNWQPNSAPL